MKIFVFETEFCHRKKLDEFYAICFCATRCRDRDFRKNSLVHTKLFVAAVCRQNVLQQLVAWCVSAFKMWSYILVKKLYSKKDVPIGECVPYRSVCFQ